MIMLGKAVKSGVLPFSIDDVTAIMEKTVKPQFVEMNKKALNWE
jgi:indolepyruvate ferredoxin oxidoreductase beta subunit